MGWSTLHTANAKRRTNKSDPSTCDGDDVKWSERMCTLNNNYIEYEGYRASRVATSRFILSTLSDNYIVAELQAAASISAAPFNFQPN